MVTWTYDATGATVTAVIDDAVAGDKYELWCSDSNSTPTTVTASSAALSVTVTGIGGDAAGYGFGAYLYHGSSSSVSVSSPCVYDNVFQEGTSSFGTGLSATWSYNGTTGFSVTFVAVGGVTYDLAAHVTTGTISSTNAGPFTNGSTQTINLTSATPTTGRSFWADLTNNSTSEDYTNRIFVQGVAGAGTSGNPGDSPPAPGGAGRVLIAFDDGPLVASPTWTVIDQGGAFPNNFVSGYDVTSGRQTLLAQTDTGTATVYINDHVSALFDPRNSSSPYFGKLDGRQIALQLYDPVAATWNSQFRGHIDNVTYDIDDADDENGDPINASIQLECVDIFDYLAGYGLTPGLAGVDPFANGTAPPAGSEDSVYYAATTGTVDDRIIEILADVDIDSTRSVVFSGNNKMLETKYNADEAALTALRDAADAELPFIANLYVDRFGRVVFHGRYGRFDPVGVAADAGPSQWDFHSWKLGDGKAVNADATRTQIRVLSYARGRSEVVNVAIGYPANTPAPQMASQVYGDTASIAAYGKHQAPPMSDLLIATAVFDSTSSYAETFMFAELLVKNQKDPRESITSIQLKSINPSTPRSANVWSCLTQSDVSDVVNVKVGYPDGTGFTGSSTADDYFIEGRNMTVRPANETFDYVELNLELSPFVWSADTHSVFPARG
jgi:hypothetical protein